MKLKKLIEERLVSSIRKRLGERLASVTYRCLEHEIVEEKKLEDPELYIGGELHLSFESGPLILTWDENAGWNDHFSLYAGFETLFLPDANMRLWEASHLLPWANCVGKSLLKATVLGDFSTPHAVVFGFGDSVVVIADGSEKLIGDGDDLLIRDERGLAEVKSWEVMWKSF